MRRRLLALAVAWQLLMLGVLVFPYVRAAATGETVLLRVMPVDPRDPFRGEYVTLSLEVSRLTGDFYVMDYVDERARQVYLPLQQDPSGIWSGTELLTERPSGGVFLRGRIASTSNDGRNGTQVIVEYGLEQFFVEEGLGPRYERAPEGTLTLEARVGRDGLAVPRRLLVNGEPLRNE